MRAEEFSGKCVFTVCTHEFPYANKQRKIFPVNTGPWTLPFFSCRLFDFGRKRKKKNKPVNSSTESVYSHITDSSVVDYFSDSNYLQIYAKRVVLVLSNRAFRILLRIVFGAQKLQATRIYLHIPSACSCSSAASLNRLACTIILRWFGNNVSGFKSRDLAGRAKFRHDLPMVSNICSSQIFQKR